MTGQPCVCPRYQRAAELLGRRWSAAVIRVALDGPTRFGEFRAAIPGLSGRLLSERLREMETEGLMIRVTRTEGVIEYRLTGKGQALTPAVVAIERWVADWDQRGG